MVNWFEKVLIGWEIETNIRCESDACESCDISPCEDCDLCYVCDLLVREHEEQGYRVERYCSDTACRHGCLLIIHGHRPERIAPQRMAAFCDECRRHGLYDDFMNHICEECGYRYREPREVAEKDYEIDMDKFERAYVDGSCGLELPTKPYPLLQFPYEIYPEWLKVKDEIDVGRKCGCHVNISHPCANNLRHARDVVVTSLYFSDMLAWLFLTKDTVGRSGSHFRDIKIDVYYDFLKGVCTTEKYSFLNIKLYDDCYVYEYRWVDGAVFFNATYIASVLCSMMVVRPVLQYRETNYEDFYAWLKPIAQRYRDMCHSLFFDSEKQVMRNKLFQFIAFYRNEIEAFSRASGIDLLKVLSELGKKPMHKRGEDVNIGVKFVKEKEEVIERCVA